jgi:hypothetical protein
MKRKEILILVLILLILTLIVGCTPSVIPVIIPYGSINVNSTPPGAKVYLDNDDTEQVTPIVLTNVEVGKHTIKLDLYHYKIWEDTNIKINKDETTYLNSALTYAPKETIALQPGAEGKDTMVVSSFYADTPFGGAPYLDLGKITVGVVTRYYRSYLQFDLSTVPGNARVIGAYLRLYQVSSGGTASNNTIGLYQVTSDWEESVITWNTQPNSSTVVEASCTVYSGSADWRTWYNIGDLVQGWLDDTNRGMLLKATDETLIDLAVECWSSDCTTDLGKRPKLVIDYYIP